MVVPCCDLIAFCVMCRAGTNRSFFLSHTIYLLSALTLLVGSPEGRWAFLASKKPHTRNLQRFFFGRPAAGPAPWPAGPALGL